MNTFLDKTIVWEQKGPQLVSSTHLITLDGVFCVSCYCQMVFPTKVKFHGIFLKIPPHWHKWFCLGLVLNSSLLRPTRTAHDYSARLSSARSFILFFGRRPALPWERHKQGPPTRDEASISLCFSPRTRCLDNSRWFPLKRWKSFENHPVLWSWNRLRDLFARQPLGPLEVLDPAAQGGAQEHAFLVSPQVTGLVQSSTWRNGDV